jgi:predicted nucleic acid-binding protein
VKWLLDTNVVSEPLQLRPNSKVTRWIEAQPLEDTGISIVTLAELRDGASSALDHSRRKRLNEWIEETISKNFHDRTLGVTVPVLLDWIRLGRKLRAQGLPREATDLLIASTARVHSLTVVSRNVRHFIATGVVLYDPWDGKTHHLEAT